MATIGRHLFRTGATRQFYRVAIPRALKDTLVPLVCVAANGSYERDRTSHSSSIRALSFTAGFAASALALSEPTYCAPADEPNVLARVEADEAERAQV